MRPASQDAGCPGDSDLAAPELARFPLSLAQEGIALQQRAAPGSAIFNIPAALELLGDLDTDALRRAIADIIARHDVLRTTFTDGPGGLEQTVHPPRPAALPLLDLRDLPAAQRDSTAHAMLDAEAARPFDLSRETGLRCLLVAMGEHRHIFFWMMHHIICDGWSKSIIATELSCLYTAYHTGTEPGLPKLSARYADFVALQRGAEPGLLDAQLRYWDRQLAGVAAIPPPPTDLPGNSALKQPGESIDVSISAADATRLRALAASTRATVFMALHGCWAITLHRYCGQPDIIVGTPYGGRPTPEFEPLIGFFVNILPLRVRLHDDPSFKAVLRQIRATALDGYENSQVAFHQIAHRIVGANSGGLGVLNHSSLAFANSPYEDIRLTRLAVAPFPLTRTDVRFPLEMHLWEDSPDGSISGRLLYRADLYTRQTATGLADAFSSVTRAVTGDPDLPVSQFPIPLTTARQSAYLQPSPPPDEPGTPLTDTETTLLGIWEDLLHTDDISVTDSFPDIGGHSLLAALMVARIRDDFGADIPVSVIYQDPTARGIAAAIDSTLQAGRPMPAADQRQVETPDRSAS